MGWALLEGRLPLARHILLVSRRGGFEIAQKALAAGVPILASVSAPSSLAVKLARELGLTLVGFLRGRRFVVYSGAFRCIPAEGRIQTCAREVIEGLARLLIARAIQAIIARSGARLAALFARWTAALVNRQKGLYGRELWVPAS